MKTLVATLSFLLCCGFVSMGCDSSPTDVQVALEHYPQSLADEYQGVHGKAISLSDEQVCTARADFGHTGIADYLVAAYSNALSGVLEVLHQESSQWTVVSVSPAKADLGFSRPSLQVVDLDGDGVPEIIVGYAMSRVGGYWIFRWAPTQLIEIGPTKSSAGGEMPLLNDPEIGDLTGDGVDEVFEDVPADPYGGTPARLAVFALRDGKYREASGYVWLGVYARVNTDADHYTDRILAEPGPATLRIVNGLGGGKSMVTKGSIVLNGQVVATPGTLLAHVSEVPVTLGKSNNLEVEFAGPPDAQLLISFVRGR